MADKQVLKWELHPEELKHVPSGKPVLVDHQRGRDFPTLWVEHTLFDVLGRSREVMIVGTGEVFNAEGWEHIGSAICGQSGVWHVYWRFTQ